MSRRTDITRALGLTIIALLVAAVICVAVAIADASRALAQHLLIQGEVEDITPDQLHIRVAGQWLQFERPTNLREGNLVAVFPLGDPNEITHLRAVRVADHYLPGISQVTVTGTVNAVDAPLGRVRVGELWIDYVTQLSATPQLEFNPGDRIRASGVQPARGGLLIADTVAVEEGAALNQTRGISGGTARGVGGTGRR